MNSNRPRPLAGGRLFVHMGSGRSDLSQFGVLAERRGIEGGSQEGPVNRSLIVPYPHESPGRIRYDSVCKTAAKIVNIVKVEHTLPLRDGVCSTNAQIRDGSSYLVIRKSGTTVTPHLYSLE